MSEHTAESDAPTLGRRLLRSWRKSWCSNGDATWGHLCDDGEGCQR